MRANFTGWAKSRMMDEDVLEVLKGTSSMRAKVSALPSIARNGGVFQPPWMVSGKGNGEPLLALPVVLEVITAWGYENHSL